MLDMTDAVRPLSAVRSSRQLRIGAVIAVAIAIGAAMRLWAFGGGRALWLDEAMVVLNLLNIPVLDLSGTLGFHQIAPTGWLLFQKAAHMVWPDVEFSQRAPALIGGLAALAAFAALARRVLPIGAAGLAILLFAVSPTLIRYSAEAKPYIFDVLTASLILYCAYVALNDPARRTRATLALAATGAVAAFFTIGGLMVAATTGVVLFAASVVRGDRAWSLALAAVGAVWAAAVGAQYFMAYADYYATVGAEAYDSYWGNAFAPAPLSADAVAWYARTAHTLIGAIHNGLGTDQPLKLVYSGLLAVALAAGGVVLVRSDRWLFALLAAPVVMSVLAALLQVYPMTPRLQLALAPSVLVTAAAGVSLASRSAGRRSYLVLAAAAIVLAAGPLAIAMERALKQPPFAHQEVRPLLAHIAAERGPDALLMTTRQSRPALLIYAQEYDLAGMRYAVGHKTRGRPDCALRDAALVSPEREAWILISHEADSDVAGNNLLLGELERRGSVTLAMEAAGSRLYRYAADTSYRTPDFVGVPGVDRCPTTVPVAGIEPPIAARAGIARIN